MIGDFDLAREIGSEFWDVPVIEKRNGLFPKSTQWYLCGRSALQAIIADLEEVQSVSLPSWCCDSMIKPFIDAGLDVHFYPVYWQNGLVQEISMDSDVLFLMDFFGVSGQQLDLSEYKGIIIRDVTHSLFSATYDDADYYFGSLRKWCGIWTGGYSWTRNGHKLYPGNIDNSEYVDLREKAMQQKTKYIAGERKDKEYLRLFDEAEEYLENVGIALAKDQDISLAVHLDVEKIVERRRANAEVLRKELSDWLIFPTLADTDTPMFVPVLVPDGKRDVLRQHLINNEIYCPIHWPVSEYHDLDERTLIIYKNELSLVCDQRYTDDDMSRVVESIKQFMED